MGGAFTAPPRDATVLGFVTPLGSRLRTALTFVRLAGVGDTLITEVKSNVLLFEELDVVLIDVTACFNATEPCTRLAPVAQD